MDRLLQVYDQSSPEIKDEKTLADALLMSFKDQKVKDRTKTMEEKVKTMKLITKKMYEITGLGNEAENKKKATEAAAA